MRSIHLMISKYDTFTSFDEYTVDDTGKLVLLDLEDGVYYSREIPLTPEGTSLLNEPVISKHYVAEGMVYLESVKYATKIRLEETKAPEGFYFDDPNMSFEVTPEYTINQIALDRINNTVVVITNTGIALHEIRPVLYAAAAVLSAGIISLVIYRKRFGKR